MKINAVYKHDQNHTAAGWLEGHDQHQIGMQHVPARAGKGEGGRSKMRSLLVNRSAISWLCFSRASKSCTAPSLSST